MLQAGHRRRKAKRLKRLMSRPRASHPGRECGGCTACCTVMAVREFAKGMYRSCSHVGSQGCSIYEERPLSCRVWSCQWQLGEIDGDRPDRSGVVVNLGFRSGPHYEVFELWNGAAAQPSVLQTLAQLRLPAYVFPYKSKGCTGLEHQGLSTHTNHCPFGHGEPNGRTSLPLVSEEHFNLRP
jgi:hypothetical protein